MTIYFLYKNFTALISKSCKTKRNSLMTCLGSFWFKYKRSRNVNKRAPHTEGVTPQISPILEIERLLLPGSFRNVPVDSLLSTPFKTFKMFNHSLTTDYSANKHFDLPSTRTAFLPGTLSWADRILTHYLTMPHFDVLKIYSFGKHFEIWRNCL